MLRPLTRWQFGVLLAAVSILLPRVAQSADTGTTGGGQVHPNMQPSLAVNYLVALQGIFPPHPTASVQEFLGSLTMFAGDFAPQKMAMANGQLLPSNQNFALNALYGTTYGGDGTTTFALPDLRGRAPMGAGQGTGLSSRALGAQVGVENVALSIAELPPHSHTLPVSGSTGSTGGGLPHENMQSSLALNYIVSLFGVLPQPGEGLVTGPFIGQVSLFGGDFAPNGWKFADGSLLSIEEYPGLFGVLGTTYGGNGNSTFALPDLRGRVPIGAGSINWQLGDAPGEETASITTAQMPAHSHSLTPSGTTGNTGGGAAHANMQPSLAMNYIIARLGVSPNGGVFNDGTPFIGEMTLFAGNFAPAGWLIADGSLMPISGNEDLYNVLGTTFGGDGIATFALPDLRGRAAIGFGQGPGLTNRPLGQKVGVESVVLTEAQLPPHSHTFDFPDGDYNHNFVVDAADYTVWRNAIISGNLDADGNGDQMITRLDYDVWTLHYGETGGSGATANVPEPATAALLLAAVVGCYAFAAGRGNILAC